MTITWRDGALALLLVGVLAMTARDRDLGGPRIALLAVPLVDREALAAHADSAGVPRAAAYALAWMESRDGRRGNAYRGPGRLVEDTTRLVPQMVCVWAVPRTPNRNQACWTDSVYATKRVCREVGRMQINPCAGLERGNPRCAYKRVRENIDDNYACGLWYYRTLQDRYGSARKAFSRYNGGNPQYAKDALAQAGEWWFDGLLAEEDR